MPRSIRLKRKREVNRAISVDRKGLLELIENLLRKKQPRGILQGNPKNVSKKILKNNRQQNCILEYVRIFVEDKTWPYY